MKSSSANETYFRSGNRSDQRAVMETISALHKLPADMFALFLKTKNFH
jgi:DNA-binding ferritin-like protein